jgi:hypothetical protein|tara:strand:- start:1389 stop:1772 length:384 start_codon:yes stop_codon:yes gene_type:complete
MALTLEYSVTNLKVKDEVNAEGVTLSNAVCQTFWKVVGTDPEGNTTDWAGATPFTAANVPAGSFTAFENLEESTVIGWITAVVEADEGYKAHIVGQLQRQLDESLITDADMPWAEDVTPDPAADPAP